MNGKSTEITLNPVITAGAYSANDVAGGLLVFTLPDAFPISGIIRSIRVVDDDNEKAAFKLHLFNAKPTLFADNAAFNPVVEDLKKRIGQITVGASDYVTLNSNAHAVVSGLALDFIAPSSTLYGYLVFDATPTYTATSDLSITLVVFVM